MFGNRRKTIGVFINRSEMEFQQLLIQGLVSEALNCGFNVVFMDSYGIRESKNMYDYYESAIVNFAPMEEFDAMIVALDTFDSPIMRSKLIEGLQKRAKCPVISFREDNDSFYSITTEVNNVVKKIVHHFAEDHQVKRFGFMAGYEGHTDSELRLKIFEEELHRLGLSLESNAVFRGDMWKLKGEEAYRFFFEGNGIRPDGIICANDFMARALCDALQSHGLRIPQDVRVSGFDNVKEAYNAEPGLTTVTVDYAMMAREAVKLVDSLLKGEKRSQRISVPAQLVLRDSCCENETQDILVEAHYSRKLDNFQEKHNHQMYFSIDMDGCANYKEMYHIIENNLDQLGDYKDFYLCLFEKRDEDGVLVFDSEIPKQAILKMACHEGRSSLEKEIVFEQKDLLPSELAEDKPFIGHFTLLHNRSKCFGYTAVSYKDPAAVFDSFFHNWNLTLSLTINELSTREKLTQLSKKNEENSITDYLTGLYNRRGLEKMVFSKWKEWTEKKENILFFSIDLDRLKYINDTFGHKEGDRAITTAAEAISSAAGNAGLAARTGGDEFEVILKVENEGESQRFCEEVQKNLDAANVGNELYQVGVSIGSYCKQLEPSDSYEECIRHSDAQMYENKKIKKISRGKL